MQDVVISSILPKNNIKLSKEIRQVNDHLEELCKDNGVHFLSNDNISRNFICGDGVHLEKKGTHVLAGNFVNFFNTIYSWHVYATLSPTNQSESSNCSSQSFSNESDDPNNTFIFSKGNIVDDLDTLKKRNPDKLIFGNLNINSLSSKFDQMKVLLQGKVDILVLTESKLDDTFPLNHFIMEGYSPPYRFDRNRNGGGVIVYLQFSLQVFLKT